MASALVLSCGEDDNRTGNTKVTSVARWGDVPPGGGRTAANTTINAFWVNVTDIGFDDDDDDDQYPNELRGPFTLALVTDGNINREVLGVIALPEADFDDVEFKIEKNTDTQSPIHNKSVLIKGSVDGKAFEFSHAGTRELEIDFDDDGMLFTGKKFLNLELAFDLNLFLDDATISKIASAKDDDNDGIIEIAPNDSDGNNALASEIWNRLQLCIDLDDDDDDEGDDDDGD